MNTKDTIGLKRISGNNLEITPCEAQLKGLPVIIGHGIKRAFSDLNLNFQNPCKKYIEQFFFLEVKNHFVFEDPTLSAQFIENVNDYCCRLIYILYLKLSSEPTYPPGVKKPALVISAEDDSRFCSIVNKLVPCLNKIHVIGQSNLSTDIKLGLFKLIHDTTLTFIDDLLIETGQFKFEEGISNITVRIIAAERNS